MTFDDYQKAALRTASMGLGPDLEMCVRALGLCGEAREFADACHYGSADDEVKEAGDVLWYTAALAESFGITDADLRIGDLENAPFGGDSLTPQLMNAACHLAELVKKHVGHKKPANKAVVVSLLGEVFRTLACTSIRSINKAAERNVDKLKARYPNGFDVAIASAKADDTALVQAHADADTLSQLPPGAYRIRETIRVPTEASGFDANGSPVEDTPGHFPEGTMCFDPQSGEWKPGPV